ncbi:hypothetical protein GR160_19185, partial [Flavobacterium sp. Sd200]|uniref:beta strand repeat-containing protein n=1 Tax=Flavobacterium sp. Sd200 TaxID=2692211 RepID=UPI00136A5E20
MFEKNKRQGTPVIVLLFFFALLISQQTAAQIYQHNFGTTTINAPAAYSVAPTVLNPNLSGSSWTNSAGPWTSNTGATGQALQFSTAAGTNTITLTFNVASGFQANINAYSFWTRRSSSGPQNWEMSINGTVVDSDLVTVPGSSTGNTSITPLNGLTGTVTVQLTLSNASGGNFRIDDFTLYGTVTSNCNGAIINRIDPVSGPVNTVVTFYGSNFTNTTSVAFDGVPATAFTVISDTELKATVPLGVTAGELSVTSNGCTGAGAPPGTFTLIDSNFRNPDIYISEIYDAYSGVPGAIELYNPTTQPVVLDGRYRLLRYGDIGDQTPSYDMSLTGTINPGRTFIVGLSIGSICPGVTSDFPLTNGINANDEFELLKDNDIIDNAEIRAGTSDLGGRGYSLVRKPNARAPKINFDPLDWDLYGTERCDFLGSHDVTPLNDQVTITHPQSQNICDNTSVSLTAAVSTGTGLTYQWKVLDAAGAWINVTNNSTYSGATTGTLTINANQSFDGSQYYCSINSTTFEINTNAAQIEILSAGPGVTTTLSPTDCSTNTATVSINTAPATGITFTLGSRPSQNSNVFSSVAPGTYSITVSFGACTSTGSVTVPPGGLAPLVATVGSTDCATNQATITITAPTGTGITYTLDGGTPQTSTNFTAAPGTHTIVASSGGCSVTDTNVTVAPGSALSPVIATVGTTSCATNQATITITAPTGTGIMYSLDGGTPQASTSFTVAPGTHTIVATLGSCSVTNNNIVVAQPTPLNPLIATVGTTSCVTNSATITVTAPTGTGIMYSLDGGTPQASTSFTAAPGTHTIVATLGSCSVTNNSIVVAQPTPLNPIVATVGTTSCATNQATITITAPTGTGIIYSLDGGTPQASTSFTAAPGTHTIVAT